jgi:hypothetical protein
VKLYRASVAVGFVALFGVADILTSAEHEVRKRSDPERIVSSWDDLLDGVNSPGDWHTRRADIKRRYLELLRDDRKPPRPPLDLQVHETTVVDGQYQRLAVSYQVEEDERAHAFVGIPLNVKGPVPGIVALHGTFAQGTKQAAGLVDKSEKAYLDHLARRGFVVIAPEHFVSGERIPPEGAYETGRFYDKHPDWTAVGKFTYEHSIAIDVLETFDEVDKSYLGAMGHSLGGQGTIFLAAYDERIKAAASNCTAHTFRQNAGVEHWSRDKWYIYFKHLRPGIEAGELPPIDFHEIMALIAPRAYLDVVGLNDGNRLTQRQRVLGLLKVADVYELVGKPENFSFYAHGRGHSIEHESRALMYGFLEVHLKPESTRVRLVGE